MACRETSDQSGHEERRFVLGEIEIVGELWTHSGGGGGRERTHSEDGGDGTLSRQIRGGNKVLRKPGVKHKMQFMMTDRLEQGWANRGWGGGSKEENGRSAFICGCV